MSPFLGASERLVLIRDGCYSPDSRRRVRAAMILGLDRGMAVTEVARGAGCHRTTVYYWLHLYKKYRDPSTLSGVDPLQARAKGRGEAEARARAVNALRPSLRRRSPVSALAPLGVEALATLCHEACSSADPSRKLAAAIAWARERGVPPRRVAKAAGMSSQAAYEAWRRARGLLEGGCC